MKKILLLFCLFTSSLIAQELQSSLQSMNLIDRAQAITDVYASGLILDGELRTKFEKTVAQFLVKRRYIEESDYKRDKKIALLQSLSDEETQQMEALIGSDQIKAYKKIKVTVQPLFDRQMLKPAYLD
ncbi:hypothetical protein ACFQ1M_07035 [Sungkyunkwania multivorans]|uniref:Peptidylprolyl isomerase n=1 Tax=Sungkyunkwania multivorans TaxID=1173618 RepID=A0ABW3CW10_9FLAO